MSPGGLEKFVLDLGREQIQNGHEVAILSYDSLKSWEHLYRENNFQVYSLKKKEGLDLSILSSLKNIIGQYDIIHTHDISPLIYVTLATAFRKKSNTRFIHTIHGLSQIEKNFKYKLYESVALNFIDSIVCVSKTTQHYYLRLFPYLAKRIVFIPNGINIPQKQNKSEEKNLSVVVSRVVPLKNIAFLIRCFQEMKDQRLIIIGPHDDQEYLNSLPESSNIELLGPKDNISLFLNKSQYFLSASTSEGLPLSVLEAMAYKIPCLLSDIPGHKQFGKNALYFENNKKQSFIENFNKLQKTNIQEKAYEWVKENYNINKTYKSYLDFYFEA